MTEVLLAAFIVSAVIAPLVYYFSAADRQTRFTEKRILRIFFPRDNLRQVTKLF